MNEWWDDKWWSLEFQLDDRDQKTPAFYDYIGHLDYNIKPLCYNGCQWKSLDKSCIQIELVNIRDLHNFKRKSLSFKTDNPLQSEWIQHNQIKSSLDTKINYWRGKNAWTIYKENGIPKDCRTNCINTKRTTTDFVEYLNLLLVQFNRRAITIQKFIKKIHPKTFVKSFIFNSVHIVVDSYVTTRWEFFFLIQRHGQTQ